MKKIVVFGGGTGLSSLLSGLKLFPLDVTTVITVTDNGSSTGQLREELDIPAVGDIGKVLLSMANVDRDFTDLLGYRFDRGKSLYNHPIRNILLAALIDQKGSLTEAAQYMGRLLNIKGTVLPLTEEKVDLVGKDENGNTICFGEVEVGRNIARIHHLEYDHEIVVGEAILKSIRDADLILFSYGSLYTSILPHLLSTQIRQALSVCRAPLMYVCNLVTQPGETDHYTASQHVAVLDSYLDGRSIDLVLANNAPIDEETRAHYLRTESKIAVELDREVLQQTGKTVIGGDIFRIDNGRIRHDALKTSYLIFSYLMDHEEL